MPWAMWSPDVGDFSTPETTNANLPSRTSWPIPAGGAGGAVYLVGDGAWVLDVEERVLLLMLLPITAKHAVQPPTNPKTTRPIISRIFGADVGRRRGPGYGGDGATAVHWRPSQYRKPGWPLGSGYQPGGDGAFISAPDWRTNAMVPHLKYPNLRAGKRKIAAPPIAQGSIRLQHNHFPASGRFAGSGARLTGSRAR